MIPPIGAQCSTLRTTYRRKPEGNSLAETGCVLGISPYLLPSLSMISLYLPITPTPLITCRQNLAASSGSSNTME